MKTLRRTTIMLYSYLNTHLRYVIRALLLALCATATTMWPIQNHATPPSTSTVTRITVGQTARVCGVLTTEHHYGPPNFGENPKTDSTFTAWVLRTLSPVAVIVPGDTKYDTATSRIQLYFQPKRVEHTQIGQAICVTGTSAEATTPGDIAPINITVETITTH